MARKKSKRVDPRERRMISAFFDMDKFDESEVVKFNDEVRGVDGSAWKHVMKDAILLFRDLLNNDFSRLTDNFPIIQKSLLLYESIKRGDLSVMREMFPERYEVFRLQMESDLLEKTTIRNNHDVLAKLDEIERQIKKVKVAPPTQQSGNIQQIGGGPKPLPLPTFDDDDDDDLISVENDENAGRRAALNFLASINNLQG